MRVFLATRYGHRLRSDFRALLAEILDAGHEVVSRWHDIPDPGDAAESAALCLGDLRRADVVVVWSEDLEAGGGCHFEHGYAHARGLRVIVLGPSTTIYHAIAERVTTPAELLAALEKLPRKGLDAGPPFGVVSP